MLIDCPACATQYDVPDDRVRPNLRLRCGRCATEWVALVPPEVAAVEAPAAVETPPVAGEPDDIDRPDRPVPSFLTPGPRMAPGREPPRGSAALPYSLVAAWLVSVVVLGGAGWAAVHWRAPIMQTWPPATRAYTAVGLLDGAQAKD